MTLLSDGVVMARKEHACGAYHWINQSNFGEKDFDTETWNQIKEFVSNGAKILPGQKYISQKSVDGDGFSHFRADPGMHKICIEYELYPED